MTEITVIRVPKGEAFFEGAVAGQTSTKPGTAFGGDPSYLPGGQMVGGGTQVYVPHVPDAWKVPLQHARPH